MAVPSTTALERLAYSDALPSPASLDGGGKEASSEACNAEHKSDIASAVQEERAKTIPWRHKGPVLALVVFFEVAVYWMNGMSSIKATIRQELRINNAQYGVMSSAQSLVNTVIPFFSGALLDYYGAEGCSLVASSIVFVGYLIAAAGAQSKSYPVLVLGEVLAGVGDITVRTAQLKITAHWFRVISKATAVPIARTAGFAWFFWVAVLLQAVVMLLNTAYFLFERRVPPQYRASTGRGCANAASGGEAGRAKSLKRSMLQFWESVWLLPAFFWLLLVTQLLQNGVVISFQTLSADMIRVTRGTSESKAGWISAVGQIPVIILTPLTGVFFDRIGFRVHFIALSAILWIAIFCLLAYTQLNPIAITMLQSLPYAINLIPLQAVIALSVGPLQQGSAQGSYQTLVNAGTVLVSVAAGAIQDATPAGRGNYNRVLIFLLAIKAWDVVAGVLYCVLDVTSLDRILSRSNKQQRKYDEKVASGEAEKRETPLLQPKRAWTGAALAIMLGQGIAAWVVYLKFSVS
ncbi:hypothetical protein JCM10213v2_001753 [Rhodosporidiobolus nylandii]